MSDINIHKIMHALCLRAGKKVEVNQFNDHWINDDVYGISVCILCEKAIVDQVIELSDFISLRDKHAIHHLKEYNLLPFL